MAKNNRTVLLGYKEKIITDHQVDFTVNKIGGTANFPNGFKIDPPHCPLCHLPRPLIVQIYAPLEDSEFHRTLYLFGCINPACWKSSASWLCIRVQIQQENIEDPTPVLSKKSAIDWCVDADDWDVEDNVDIFETNMEDSDKRKKISEGNSTCSLEDSFEPSMANLSLIDGYTEKNNIMSQQNITIPTAEIEAPESNNPIILETPTLPQCNVAALLNDAAPVPRDISAKDNTSGNAPVFVSYFMAVWQEDIRTEEGWSSVSENHVKELLKQYQQKNETTEASICKEGKKSSISGAMEIPENYEKSYPAHGDKLFHQFLSKIQANSGQILRYSRDSIPLLLYALEDIPKCQHCQGRMVFEFQLVPTIISKLMLTIDPKQVARLDFGTVLVYTCEESCWKSDATNMFEFVVVQKELY